MDDLQSESGSEATLSLGTQSELRTGSVDMTEEEEMQLFGAAKIQSCVRTFLVRAKLLKQLRSRYEKILDPNRKRHYYYDKKKDKSSWKKPLLFRQHDVEEVSNLYSEEEAATKLQVRVRMMLNLLRVRLMYQDVVEKYLDEESGDEFFHNPRSGNAMWALPGFMADRLDYARKEIKPAVSVEKSGGRRRSTKAKKSEEKSEDDAVEDEGEERKEEEKETEGDEEDDDAEEEESEESGLSDDSEAIREKRRANRKYPRSKAQEIIDAGEDNIEETQELCLAALGAMRVSSRLYDLVELRTLDLSENKLFRISPNIQFLTNLQRLDLHKNRLQTLPKEMEELIALTELNVSYNLMRGFPGNIYKLKKMKKLELAHNKFKEIPMESGNLELLQELGDWEIGINLMTSITHLDVSHCYLTEWPDRIQELTQLQYLDLSHNMIVKVPDTIESHPQLRFLYMSHNRLDSLPLQLYGLQQLEVLSLEHNYLQDLPAHAEPELLAMPALIELNISHNVLQKLDDRLGIFFNLKRLDLCHNHINTFYGISLSKLTNLTHMDLSYNGLTTVSSGIAQCSRLLFIDVSHNELTEVPGGLANAPKVLHMNFSFNRIYETSGKIYGMMNDLQRLELQHNEIDQIPILLYTLHRLQHLNLSFNLLTTVADGLGNMKALEYLNLSHNRINALPSTLGEITILKELELEYNKLRELPDSILRLRHLHRVTINNNNLQATPALLETLPLIISMNLAWNPELEGHNVNWVERTDAFNPKKDFIRVQVLERKVQQAKDRLDRIVQSEKTPATLYSFTGSDELKDDDTRGPLKTQDFISMKAKRKSAKKAAKKLDDTRKKTLLTVKWHDNLAKHLAKHAAFGDDSLSAAAFNSKGAAAATDIMSIASSRTPLTKATSFGPATGGAGDALEVVSETMDRISQRLEHDLSVQMRSIDRKRGKPVPWFRYLKLVLRGFNFDEDILDSIDIGNRFQVSIEQFAYLLNEIDVLAFLSEIRYHLQTEALWNMRAAEARGDFKIRRPNTQALQHAKELHLSGNLPRQYSTVSLSPRSITPRKAEPQSEPQQCDIGSVSFDENASDLSERSGMPTTALAPRICDLPPRIPSQKLIADADLLPNGPSQVMARIVKPSLSVSLSRIPYIAHFSRATGPKGSISCRNDESTAATEAEILAILFDCLLCLGKALLLRADCFRDSIRRLEVRSGVHISCLDIAQRSSVEDSLDIMVDVYESMVDEVAARAATAAKRRIFSKKQDIFVEEEAIDIQSDADDADEQSVQSLDASIASSEGGSVHNDGDRKEKGGKRKPRKKKKKNGKRNENKLNQSTAVDSALKEESSLQHLLPPLDLTKIVDDPMHQNECTEVIQFLFAHRMLTLLWAGNCLEVAGDILRSRGWDPQYPGFRLHGSNTYSDEPEWLARGALRLSQIRARLYQALGAYGKAKEDYRNYVRLSKGMRVRHVFINMLKICLAQGDFFEAEHIVYDTIRALYRDFFPDKDLNDKKQIMPSPLDLLNIDKELALLYRYTLENVNVLRETGIFDTLHSRVHSQQENGLLSCQKYVSIETRRGTALEHKKLHDARAKERSKNHAEFELLQSREEIRRLIVESKFNAQKLIDDTNEEIATHKAATTALQSSNAKGR